MNTTNNNFLSDMLPFQGDLLDWIYYQNPKALPLG